MAKVERENFTAERVARYKCEEGKQQSIHWDLKTPGLGLRVTAKGAKSYIFETWLNGKSLRVTIGDVRTLMVGQAQAEARRMKAVTDQGIAPRQLKAEKAAAAAAKQLEIDRQQVTLGEAWSAYIEARKHKWSARHAADHAAVAHAGGSERKRGGGKTIAAPLASLLTVKLSDLTDVRIAKWLAACRT